MSASATTLGESACGALGLKLFDLHDSFNRHLGNALQPLEYMRAIEAHQIDASQAHQLDLGALQMREYKLDTTTQPIRKSAFLNHVAVLSFRVGDRVHSASFAVKDETYSRDVYMSPSEAVVLRFKDNLLDCVALNPASPALASFDCACCDGACLNEAFALRFAVDKQLSRVLESREHTFEQFSDLVVPLCAPSFIKRAKAALKGATQSSVVLSVAGQPLSLDGDEPEGPEQTKRVMFMVGQNAVMAAKNKHSYTFQRQTYHSRDNARDYIDVYSFEAVNAKPFSFATLVDKKGRSKVLVLTVPDPLTQKPHTVHFKLSNTKNVASVGSWQGSKAGLVFHMDAAGGNLTRLASSIRRRRRVAVVAAARPTPATAAVHSPRRWWWRQMT